MESTGSGEDALFGEGKLVMRTYSAGEDTSVVLWPVTGVRECSLCEAYDEMPLGGLLEDVIPCDLRCECCGDDLTPPMDGTCYEVGVSVAHEDLAGTRGFLVRRGIEEAQEWAAKTFPPGTGVIVQGWPSSVREA